MLAAYRPLMHILFVCTGNLCRSPVAERLARTWASRSLRNSPEHPDIQISSAGLEARSGMEMDPRSAKALVDLGGDPAGFHSRTFVRSMAERADLVFTMTRRQRRDVLEMTPRGLRRTFTVAEAAALLDRADLSGFDVLPLAERARELGMRLDAARSRRATRATDDIFDPIGRAPAVHRDVAATIAGALRPLADILFISVGRVPAVEIEDKGPAPSGAGASREGPAPGSTDYCMGNRCLAASDQHRGAAPRGMV